MGRIGGFSVETIRTLAERAHHHCSNPDCGVQTSMPVEGSRKTLRVGEAAHIHGLGRDVPRFREDLSPADLADITNGIWLCCNCHAKIDKSGDIYSAELLFKWKAEHEEYVRSGFSSKLNFRQMVTSDLDLKMPEASSRARQIARDLPYAWEYKLTSELIYEFAGRLEKRARGLRDGLYTRRGEFIHPDHYCRWFTSKMAEISEVAQSEGRLINEDLPKAWGEPGVPGDKFRIYDACVRIRDAFLRQIEFEEDMRFTYSDSAFDPIRNSMKGFSYNNMRKLCDFSKQIKEVFDRDQPNGCFEFELLVGVHDNFHGVAGMLEDCMCKYLAGAMDT